MNAAMTASYWLIEQHIVEFEQWGDERAEYGTALIKRLSDELTQRLGRGFSLQNIWQMRLFYRSYLPERILQTPSEELTLSTMQPVSQTVSPESPLAGITSRFSGRYIPYATRCIQAGTKRRGSLRYYLSANVLAQTMQLRIELPLHGKHYDSQGDNANGMG